MPANDCFAPRNRILPAFAEIHPASKAWLPASAGMTDVGAPRPWHEMGATAPQALSPPRRRGSSTERPNHAQGIPPHSGASA